MMAIEEETQRQFIWIDGGDGTGGQAEREFKVEVEAIGRVRHKNLVRLLGYCAEGEHRMLVYEYVDNGNLDQWLHGDVGPYSPLTWDIRMKIILGTAKRLTYLHEGLEPKVAHQLSESLHEMGNCLLEKTALDDGGESGKRTGSHQTIGYIRLALEENGVDQWKKNSPFDATTVFRDLITTVDGLANALVYMIKNLKVVFFSKIPPSMIDFRAYVLEEEIMVMEATDLNITGRILHNLEFKGIKDNVKRQEENERFDSCPFLFSAVQELKYPEIISQSKFGENEEPKSKYGDTTVKTYQLKQKIKVEIAGEANKRKNCSSKAIKKFKYQK
ncbi:unnamed protein product [Fraxinus pennsylvanica]|uniref:non-specific serine/threonine protein kinase n=1 Tax=Fraxinus pennsylvanica TaxID=56036 RepID=A0AAD2AAM1_9LAMI|nr:unnamed protein product [Fraxinus pennsylvanica]